MKLNLWLDDFRRTPTFIESGLVWVLAKTGAAAIKILESGDVEFASLDHDLATLHCDAYAHSEDFEGKGSGVETGWDVLAWMMENNVWPRNGVRIHTANDVRRPVMLSLVKNVYGRTFQYAYGGGGLETPSSRAADWSLDMFEEEDAASTY